MSSRNRSPAGAMRPAVGWACVIGLVVHAPLAGQLPGAVQGSGFAEADGVVTTRHEIALDGRTLEYTARAGRIPIRDNATGEARGYIFFIAYSLDPPDPGSPRPLTFLWNGGPGSSSSLVHLLGFGPRRLDADGSAIDNEDTWLSMSDLVFVDPIGTGYSRPARPEYGAEFYQDRGDAESVAELIRVYLTRANAWDAPLFLAGESFGVLRATRVADVLRRRGIRVLGLMLIGLVPPLATLGEALESALAVPTYTAAAHHHGRLNPPLPTDFDRALREAETWARDEYAPALARSESLSEAERVSLRGRLASFIGVPGTALDTTLSLGMGRFARTLLGDRGLVIGRYDSRMTAPLDTTSGPYDPTRDPSLENIIDGVSVVRYLRNELGYRSDLSYQGPFGGGYPPPDSPRGDWMSVMWDRSEGARAPVDDRSSDPRPAVERILRADEALRIYVACGYYDLVCSYAAIDEMRSRLDPALRERVVVHTYHGGHAIYLDADVRRRMRQDAEAFIRATGADGAR